MPVSRMEWIRAEYVEENDVLMRGGQIFRVVKIEHPHAVIRSFTGGEFGFREIIELEGEYFKPSRAFLFESGIYRASDSSAAEQPAASAHGRATSFVVDFGGGSDEFAAEKHASRSCGRSGPVPRVSIVADSDADDSEDVDEESAAFEAHASLRFEPQADEIDSRRSSVAEAAGPIHPRPELFRESLESVHVDVFGSDLECNQLDEIEELMTRPRRRR
jgi:hypothetical protein